jgi:hypothetical protein
MSDGEASLRARPQCLLRFRRYRVEFWGARSGTSGGGGGVERGRGEGRTARVRSGGLGSPFYTPDRRGFSSTAPPASAVRRGEEMTTGRARRGTL